jgi:hypothetical protein
MVNLPAGHAASAIFRELGGHLEARQDELELRLS